MLFMLVLGLTAVHAGAALVVGDSTYIGSVSRGVPAGDAFEQGYINTLIGRPGGSGDFQTGGQTYNRVGSTVNTTGLPAADYVTREDKTDGTIDVTGFTYLLAKFGAGSTARKQISYVWYVGGLSGNQTLADKKAASHISLFTRTPTRVPDGGVTLMLLGGALVGIETLRRRLGV